MSLNTTTNHSPCGLLLVDKPADFSSHDITAIVRGVLRTKKIGHSGTLDPMATGLLILLVGREATRLQDRFLKLDKTYQATLKLGEETDSWDSYGSVISTAEVKKISSQDLQQAIRALSGTVRQPIPYFSAKRIGGKRMYEMAREGQAFEQKFNEVTVSWENVIQTADDEISFTLQGSCGTYVRSLGYLLARQLGTVGHLTALRRMAIGPYSVKSALDGTFLKTMTREELLTHLKPISL